MFNLEKNWFVPNATEPFASFTLDGEKQFIVMRDLTRRDETHFTKTYGSLTLNVELHTHPAANAAMWMLSFANEGKEPTGRIAAVRTLDMTFAGSMLFHTIKGDDNNEDNFMPIDLDSATEPSRRIEPFGGRSSGITGAPYFDVECAEGVFTGGIGWTGQWCLEWQTVQGKTELCAGLCDPDFFLDPGEHVRAASVFLVGGDDLDDNRRAFRRLCREYYSPKTEVGDFLLPLAMGNFDIYFWTDPTWKGEEKQLSHVRACADMGFDTYWADAFWFAEGFPNGVGNYTFNELLPRGLQPIADEAHERGLKLIVWFEPERVCDGSETFREHPDYLLRVCDGVKADPAHHFCCDQSSLLNLADDRARAWLIEKINGFIRRYHIDVYRQDANFHLTPYWHCYDIPGKKGYLEMKYVEGLYEFWDALRRDNPGLLIDNCATGGRRIDFESCRRTVVLWQSDTACLPEDATKPLYQWEQNQHLMLNRYVPYHGTGSHIASAYCMRSAMTSGMNKQTVVEDENAVRQTKIALAEMKNLRHYANGDFYAHSAFSKEKNVTVSWQFAEGDAGVLYAFARDEFAGNEVRIWFDAVKPDSRYALTISDERFVKTERVMTGKEMTAGFTLPIAKRESYAVEYKPAKG